MKPIRLPDGPGTPTPAGERWIEVELNGSNMVVPETWVIDVLNQAREYDFEHRKRQREMKERQKAEVLRMEQFRRARMETMGKYGL